ncbi:MAG: RHS repeat-associated core domain-containing protein, partial [Bacteroidota bacterium]
MLTTITDQKLGILDGGQFDHYEATTVSATDYYPFGFEMPDRTFSSSEYRFGFNGKEKDEAGEFGDLTHYDYGFRIYNPAIGKFLSVDPLTKSYPMLTPYQFASNSPIGNIDLDGLEHLEVQKIITNADPALGNHIIFEPADQVASQGSNAEPILQYYQVHSQYYQEYKAGPLEAAPTLMISYEGGEDFITYTDHYTAVWQKWFSEKLDNFKNKSNVNTASLLSPSLGMKLFGLMMKEGPKTVRSVIYIRHITKTFSNGVTKSGLYAGSTTKQSKSIIDAVAKRYGTGVDKIKDDVIVALKATI